MVEFNEIIYILIFIVQINLTSAPFHHLEQSFSGVFFTNKNDSFISTLIVFLNIFLDRG